MNSKVYWANVVICISVVIFCGVKVILNPDPSTTSIYLPIMSGIIGYFVPNPTKKKENNEINGFSNQTISNSNGSRTPPLSPTLNIEIPRN